MIGEKLHYALSDLCVFPASMTFWYRGSGGCSHGKPCVVGAAGTVAWLRLCKIGNRKTYGVHVNARDPRFSLGHQPRLADIERLKIWEEMPGSAIAEFSWQKAAEKTLEIYENWPELSEESTKCGAETPLFLEEYCIIASERSKRPSDFCARAVPGDEKTCPFCPGNEERLRQALRSIRIRRLSVDLGSGGTGN